MKKYKFILSLILISFIITPLYAQEQTIFIKNFLIFKVYTHRLGYRVNYWTSKLETATIYIPMEWFRDISGKAQLILGEDASFPYLSVTWIDGKLDHVRIYAFRNMNHYTWGILRDNPELKNLFAVTDLDLQF